jgi:PAS domain S-box-containing protein
MAKAFKGYSLGAVDYLFKPIEPEILRAKVMTFVEMFRKTKQAEAQAATIESANQELATQLEEIARLNKELEATNKHLQTEAEERRLSQEAVQRSEKLYRTLAHNLPDTAVVLIDHGLNFILVEGGLAERLGSRETYEGKNVDEILTPELHDFWVPIYRAALTGQSSVQEAKFGEITYFIQVMPVYDEDGTIFAVMGMVQDISRIKKTEEELRDLNEQLERRVRERTADLRATNEELSTFTYIVSHDLRSPLVNLKGFAGELRSSVEVLDTLYSANGNHTPTDEQNVRQALEKDIPEALSFIESAVTRMDHLTTAVLNLSRMGRRDLTIEPIDMNQLIQVVLESMAHQIRQRYATVTVDPLPEVRSDRLAMEQIMGNIVSNAVKYLTNDRPGVIRVSGELNDIETIFHITDNGRGIAEEDKHKVFEPFRRAGQPDVPGEGMGLAYVQVLVRRHGGRIWFNSVLNEGSTFSFSISRDLSG